MKTSSSLRIISALLVLFVLAIMPVFNIQTAIAIKQSQEIELNSETAEKNQAAITWDKFDHEFYEQLMDKTGRFSDFALLPEPLYSNGRWARGGIVDGLYMRFITTSPNLDGLVIEAMLYADPEFNENSRYYLLNLLIPMFSSLAQTDAASSVCMLMLTANPVGLYKPLDMDKPFLKNKGYELFIGSDDGGFMVAHAKYKEDLPYEVPANLTHKELWETMKKPMTIETFIERISPHFALFNYRPLEKPAIAKDDKGRPVYTYALNDTLFIHITLKSDGKDAPIALIRGTDINNKGPFMYSVGLSSILALCDIEINTYLAINAIGGHDSIFEVLSKLTPYIIYQGVGVQFHADGKEWYSEVYGATEPKQETKK